MKKLNGTPKRPRGRARSFDRDQALDRAMEVFWRNGFEATSVSDLTAAMGINPPSLYAAFGDKEHLFLEAVQRYQAKRSHECPYGDQPTARAAIEHLLTYTAMELSDPHNPPGCLMVMTAATRGAGTSPELDCTLSQCRETSKASLKARIDLGVKEGELPPDTDTAALAAFYATVIYGMSVQAREGATRKALIATVGMAMRAWPDDVRAAQPRSKPRKTAKRNGSRTTTR